MKRLEKFGDDFNLNAKKTPPIMETNIKGGIVMKHYRVIFEVKGLENSTFNKIEELKDLMGDEVKSLQYLC